MRSVFNTVLAAIGFTALAVVGAPGTSVAQTTTLEEFISPIGNPFTFEDPRALTEARFVYLYHELGDDFVTSGGDLRAYALQLRYAADPNLSFLLTKDGYVDFNPDSGFDDQTGFANITPGVKLTVYGEGPVVAAFGLKYEIPAGSNDVFQGLGGGSFNPFFSVTGAWGPLDITLGTGFRLPVKSSDSSFYDLDLHFDTPMGNFYPTFELSIQHVLDGGTRLPISDEGLDIINFGSSNADGGTAIIGGFGGRYRLERNCDLGLMYQFPMSDGKGSNLIDWRITADLIVRFL